MENKIDKKPHLLKRFAPLIVLVVIAIAVYASGIGDYFNLESFQEHKEWLLDKVEANPVISIVLFMLLYISAVAMSLPFATFLTLLGGFLFGNIFGTFYVVTPATIGATILFLIARSSFGNTLRERAGKYYKKVEDNMKDNAVGYLLFLRLVPAFPFFLVNIIPALFNVSTTVFVLTTLFGILPGSFVYVNVGTQLADINSLGDLVSTDTLIAFALLGVISLVPTIIKQIRAKK